MAKTNNLAYDYTAYDSDEFNLPKPKIKHKRNLKLQPKLAFAMKSTILGFIGLALLCSFVFGQVELSEVYSEQSSLNEELTKLSLSLSLGRGLLRLRSMPRKNWGFKSWINLR